MHLEVMPIQSPLSSLVSELSGTPPPGRFAVIASASLLLRALRQSSNGANQKLDSVERRGAFSGSIASFESFLDAYTKELVFPYRELRNDANEPNDPPCRVRHKKLKHACSAADMEHYAPNEKPGVKPRKDPAEDVLLAPIKIFIIVIGTY